MIRLAADEDFNGIILRGLRRKFPALDVARAHTVGLAGALDEAILEWAARDERLLLTHDVTTMIPEAYARLHRGEAMWGVLVVPQWLSIGLAIEEIALVVECSGQEEWRNRVDHLPLK
jgi:hypothetical protein